MKKLDLSFFLGKPVLSLQKHLQPLQPVKTQKILLCVEKETKKAAAVSTVAARSNQAPKQPASVTLATIIGVHDAPAGNVLKPFPQGYHFLLYLFWPRFFLQTPGNRLGILYTQLLHIDPENRGKTRSGNFHYSKRPEFNDFLQSKLGQKLLNANPALHLSADEMEKRYRVTGNAYPNPEVVKSDSVTKR